jgi:hypothetical protein
LENAPGRTRPKCASIAAAYHASEEPRSSPRATSIPKVSAKSGVSDATAERIAKESVYPVTTRFSGGGRRSAAAPALSVIRRF